jgi:hypothetical protein
VGTGAFAVIDAVKAARTEVRHIPWQGELRDLKRFVFRKLLPKQIHAMPGASVVRVPVDDCNFHIDHLL